MNSGAHCASSPGLIGALPTGVESLTPTELRIAQLAAQGRSNRDVAEMIFVSRNTVAWHLRNVYRKLQIDSREELTRFVDA